MKKILEYEISYSCRFHPTDWFHEIGCPHKKWTNEELQSALESAKKTIEYHIDIFKDHPELLKVLGRTELKEIK